MLPNEVMNHMERDELIIYTRKAIDYSIACNRLSIAKGNTIDSLKNLVKKQEVQKEEEDNCKLCFELLASMEDEFCEKYKEYMENVEVEF